MHQLAQNIIQNNHVFIIRDYLPRPKYCYHITDFLIFQVNYHPHFLFSNKNIFLVFLLVFNTLLAEFLLLPCLTLLLPRSLQTFSVILIQRKSKSNKKRSDGGRQVWKKGLNI